MIRTLLLPSLAAALIAACADGGADDSPAGLGAAPEEFGTVSLAYVSAQPLTGKLTGVLVIKASSDGAEAFSDTFVLPAATKVFKQVHLAQGTYDVLLDLRDADGQPAWSGAVYDVGVVPQALTQVQIPMVAAGGVQIVVDLASRGTEFEAKSAATPAGTDYLWWAGTQRTRPHPTQPGAVVTDYIGLGVYPYNQYNKSAHLFIASSPAALVLQAPVAELYPFTYTTSCAQQSSRMTMAASADALHLACVRTGSVRVERWKDDLTDMTGVELPLAAQKNGAGLYDVVEGCALLIDNQFNLFCMVKENVDASPAGASIHSLVHASSPDGLTWTPMIPYASSSGSGKAPTLAAARVTSGGKHIFPPGMSNIGFPALHAMQTGGVYRVYAYSSGWASALVTMTTSTDRQTWSPLSLDYQATALSVSLAKMRGLGVYADTAGWAIVYVDDTGKRRLATEVQ